MKGLLIKDLRLTLKNKKLFVILLMLAVFMYMAQGYEGAIFAISYFTIMGSSFVLSTITTDEFDKSTTFLMTMPIQRKTYALEKYVFSFMCCATCWAVATIVGCILAGSSAGDLVVIALVLLAIAQVYQAIMIPIQFKFGGENGRMVLVGLFVVIFLLGFAFEKIAAMVLPSEEAAVLWMESLFDRIEALNPITTGIAVVITVIVCTCISMAISIKIIEKKEF